MKQAILLHGAAGSSRNYHWFGYIKQYLEEHGYAVWWPLLPNSRRPNRKLAMAFVLQNIPKLDENSIIIGHSSACPLILSILPELDVSIKQIILVAGFYQPIDPVGISASLLPKHGFDLEKIKTAAQEIIFINSDNDPWKCDDKQATSIAKKLGAKLIVPKGEAHMGNFNQPYPEFPLLKKLVSIK